MQVCEGGICLFLSATEILDLSTAKISARPLFLIISRTMSILCEIVRWQLGFCWHNYLVFVALHFNGYEAVGTRAANFQVFIYLRSYQRQLFYKIIFWTRALHGGWSDSLPLNHKGPLWTF